MKQLLLFIALLAITTACQPLSVVNGNQNTNTNTATTTEAIDTSDVSSEALAKEGWKTYRNEEYRFEFKYPGEYLLSGLKRGVGLKYPKESNFEMRTGAVAFSIEIIAESLQDFVKSYEDDFLDGAPLTRIVSQEKYILDGKSGVKLVGNNAEGINSYYIFVAYNGQNYLLFFDENDSASKIILSTFYFLR